MTCPVCNGTADPWVLTITGHHAGIEYLVYGGVRYFNHGAVADNGATTLWLCRARGGR